MLNFEVKTRVLDFEESLKKIQDVGAIFKETMDQTDYYFQIGTEKEKIREINNKEVCLITYKRLEKKGKKDSSYFIKQLTLKQKKLLLKEKPLLCIVDKKRQLWMYKNTRIHLDSVVGLGDFLELETVVKGILRKEGIKEFKEVVSRLGINLKKTEPSSYSDLILNKISKNEGEAIKKRENVHKMAEANKAFAHFAW